jgi:hypothetical protein
MKYCVLHSPIIGLYVNRNRAGFAILTEDDATHFLSDCAAKLGTKPVLAKECQFVDDLYKQFPFSAHLQPPEFAPDKVLINLQNGTFEVTTALIKSSLRYIFCQNYYDFVFFAF